MKKRFQGRRGSQRTSWRLPAGGAAASVLLVALACRAPSAAVVAEPVVEEARPAWQGEAGSEVLRLAGRLDEGSARLETFDGLEGASSTVSRSFDLWPYEGVEGELVTVDMRSESFDAFLVLLYEDEDEWIELDRDDDGGGKTDARIDFELPFAGTYALLATTAGSDARGDYELELRSEPPLEFAASRTEIGSGRRALLVGIEDYPGSESDLDGPNNDVALFRKLLLERFGFQDEDIIELRDARATRRNLIAAFREGLGRAGEGDLAVFYYSGHGIQTAENMGLTGAADPEADGRDEALFLADGSLLLDDELGWMVDRLRTDRALLVLDSCFSGTGSRGASGHSKRVRTEDVDEVLWLPERFLVEGTTAPPARNLEQTFSEGMPLNHVLFASSRSDQVSWTLPASAATELACSAFTWSIAEILGEADPEDTFESAMERIAKLTAALVEDALSEEQDPRVEGKRAAERVLDFLAPKPAGED